MYVHVSKDILMIEKEKGIDLRKQRFSISNKSYYNKMDVFIWKPLLYLILLLMPLSPGKKDKEQTIVPRGAKSTVSAKRYVLEI